ncbi:hypothetical protein SADUNF_Sadunf18G0008500 [Salix dunnii]|uniref:Uncharacterized protein n=1 Tax=Salix dunnii TaxID=1413687 RepID=A0A835J1Y5_9ROSI|nr:hypothetical protein SADUNF_Sadunf18G0008500 [Salix dunnii]
MKNNKYLSVRKDPASDTIKITGYNTDIFEAVVRALPYALPFEYVPFEHRCYLYRNTTLFKYSHLETMGSCEYTDFSAKKNSRRFSTRLFKFPISTRSVLKSRFDFSTDQCR